ncbi:MAG: helix-turn-helix domain-containing protein [Oscillatoriales cyanobacterium]|nr:MAG: helix-turn-helix domain-containing protein [Oscillatoriales cyanobacterium]
MAPKRLSETEKQEIAERYRQPNESTATLSRAFGVSTSTIGRLLKNSFSEEEYEELVQQKRLIGRGGAARISDVMDLTAVTPESGTPEPETSEPEVTPAPPIVRVSRAEPALQQEAPKLRSRTRTRTRTRTRSTDSEAIATDHETQLGLGLDSNLTDESVSPSPIPVEAFGECVPDQQETASRRRRRRSSVTSVSEVIRHAAPREITPPPVPHEITTRAIDHVEEDSEPDESWPRSRKRRSRSVVVSSPTPDFPVERSPQPRIEPLPPPASFDHADPEDMDDPDEPQVAEAVSEEFDLTQPMRVSPLTSPPLSEATLPKTCYLVVDRLSELISRPLQDFEELGEIPQGENQEQTLPIFDNHRVARRFANRSQRVMKIPDSRVLQKTGAHLQAKGITRVLIDGKVYSLS